MYLTSGVIQLENSFCECGYKKQLAHNEIEKVCTIEKKKLLQKSTKEQIHHISLLFKLVSTIFHFFTK